MKAMIQEIVDGENKKKPYSDQAISSTSFPQKGIKLSRRTVNKYRTEMGIPDKSGRKEFYVSYAAAIPIIMGQNIGTTVTAMLSSIGTNKNARRAAVVHLLFNVIGVVVLLTVFCIVRAAFAPALLNQDPPPTAGDVTERSR